MNDNVLSFNRKVVSDNPSTVADKKPEVIKLITGEDIIGNITGSDKTTYTIDNPVRIVIIPQQGQTSMAFLPVSPFAETKKLVVDINHVVYRLPVSPLIEAEYKRTMSGIIQPIIPELIVPKK